MWIRRLKYVLDGKIVELNYFYWAAVKKTHPQPFVNFQRIIQLSEYFHGWRKT